MLLYFQADDVKKSSHSNSNHKETICQDVFATHAGKTNLWRVARPVRKVILPARIVLMAMNTASFAGIHSDDVDAFLWSCVSQDTHYWCLLHIDKRG